MAKQLVQGISVHGLIWKQECFLITQRPSTAKFGANQWDLPGGKLEPGEDVLLGLSREIAEETGLRVHNFRPLMVHTKVIKELGRQQLNIIFECDYAGGDFVLSDEHQQASWVDIEEVHRFRLVDYLSDSLVLISERQRQEISTIAENKL